MQKSQDYKLQSFKDMTSEKKMRELHNLAVKVTIGVTILLVLLFLILYLTSDSYEGFFMTEEEKGKKENKKRLENEKKT